MEPIETRKMEREEDEGKRRVSSAMGALKIPEERLLERREPVRHDREG